MYMVVFFSFLLFLVLVLLVFLWSSLCLCCHDVSASRPLLVNKLCCLVNWLSICRKFSFYLRRKLERGQ